MNGNLLILGAGGHGRVCREVAEATGLFDRIDFLDDRAPDAVGTLAQSAGFLSRYAYAFVGIGNNTLRSQLLAQLRREGFLVPTLIHPTAYVSPSAKLGSGTLVEPMAIVNTSALVGEGCIISVGSIVDHDAEVGDGAHINAGAICKGGSRVEPLVKLEAGQVIIRDNGEQNV